MRELQQSRNKNAYPFKQTMINKNNSKKKTAEFRSSAEKFISAIHIKLVNLELCKTIFT